MHLSELSNEQVILAASLAARRIVEDVLGIRGSGDVLNLNKYDETIRCLVELDLELLQKVDLDLLAFCIQDAVENKVDRQDNFSAALDASIRVVAAGTQSVGWGSEGAILAISIGFAISWLIIVSQTEVSGKFGQFDFQKKAGVPVEIVDIVKSVSDATVSALTKSPPNNAGD